MYHTGIRDRFSASHVLIGDFGPEEAERHHHDYVVEWQVSLDALDINGFGVDIDLMVAELRSLAAELDGSHLNDLPFFRDDGGGRPRQPSVEYLAQHMNECLTARLAAAGGDGADGLARLRESRIQLWESDTAWAGHSMNV